MPLVVWIVTGLMLATALVSVGFLAGIAATVWFEWYSAAADLAPGRDD